LAAEIALLNTGHVDASQVLVSLAGPADYERVGVEREHFHTTLQFKVDIPPNATDGVIRVSTADKVVEPFINFLVDVRWPTGRILREYTVLLDLPIYSHAPQAPAPAAAARPPVAASPQAAAPADSLAGQQYRVSPNDTLWEIAARSRPDGRASIFQMMIAIQQQNPQAFLNNNINLLRSGATLDIPTEDQALAISSGESQAAVREQNAQWRDTSETSVQPLTTAADIAEPAAAEAAGYEGHLRLAAGEGAGEVSGAAVDDGDGTAAERIERLRDALASTSEELDVARRENAELQQRVALLEQQVQTSDELDALRASVESDAMATVATAVTTTDETTDTTGADVADEAAAGDDLAAEAADSVTDAAAEDAVAAGTNSAETTVADEPAPVNTKSTVDGEEREESIPWLWVAAGGAVVLLLLGVLIWRRRTAYVEFEYEAEPVKTAPSTGAPGVSTPVVKAKDTMATLDRAFDHFERGEGDTARAMLRAAIDKEPHRSDLRMGLLQMLAAIDDKDGVERQYAALQAIATPEELQRAETFLARSSAVQEQVANAARPVTSKPNQLEQELADIELDLARRPEPPADDVDLDSELVQYTAPDGDGRAPLAADESGDDPEFDLDIDLGDFGELDELDLGDDGIGVDAEAPPAVAAPVTSRPAVLEPGPGDFAGLETDLAQETLDLPEFSEREGEGHELDDIFEEETASPDLDLDTAQDEVATKLELAEAYIDMDDYDAAREILREVIVDGSREQQDRARELMGSIT